MAFWKRYSIEAIENEEAFVASIVDMVNQVSLLTIATETAAEKRRTERNVIVVQRFVWAVARHLEQMSTYSSKKVMYELENVSIKALRPDLNGTTEFQVYYVTDEALLGVCGDPPIARILIFSTTLFEEQFQEARVLACTPRIRSGVLAFDCRDFSIVVAKGNVPSESLANHLRKNRWYNVNSVLETIGGRWKENVSFSTNYTNVSPELIRPFEALWHVSGSLVWPMFDVELVLTNRELGIELFDAELHENFDGILLMLLLDQIKQSNPTAAEIDFEASKYVHFASSVEVKDALELQRLLIPVQQQQQQTQ